MDIQEFQFPPNGKAHVDTKMANILSVLGLIVSIPSKREGTCRRRDLERPHVRETVVSIPSKREGTCRRENTKSSKNEGGEFQFPPNGKAHVDAAAAADEPNANRCRVSIPSKREGTCRPAVKHSERRNSSICVSIPSKREGTCRQKSEFQVVGNSTVSFNSLQTGRHM